MRPPRHKVLVIDDNALMGEILADYLRTDDLAVHVAKSGEQGLRLLATESIDIVVIDLVMPGMNGLEILSRATRREPHPEVIIVTAFGTVETAVRAIQLGAFDYLQKPVNPEVLRETVLRAIERRRLLTSNEDLRHGVALYDHCRRIVASTERTALLEQSLWGLLAATDARSGLVRLLTGETRAAAHEGLTESQALDLGRNLEEHLLRDAPGQPFVTRLEAGVAALVAPVGWGEERIALMAAFQASETDFHSEHLRNARFLAEQVGFALRFPVRSTEDRAEHYVDMHTGLYNARYFDVLVDRELVVAQADPRGRTFSLLLVAVDEIGELDDRVGHRIGGKALVEVARVVRHRVRDVDPVFRLRADQFSVLLRGSGYDEAQYVAERIRRAIADHPFLKREGLDLRLSVSIALASYPEHASSKERLMEVAEAALASERQVTVGAVEPKLDR